MSIFLNLVRFRVQNALVNYFDVSVFLFWNQAASFVGFASATFFFPSVSTVKMQMIQAWQENYDMDHKIMRTG